MKKIRVGNSYVTDIELSRGKLETLEFDINKQPIKFNEEDIEEFRTAIEEIYKDKEVEVIVEDY